MITFNQYMIVILNKKCSIIVWPWRSKVKVMRYELLQFLVNTITWKVFVLWSLDFVYIISWEVQHFQKVLGTNCRRSRSQQGQHIWRKWINLIFNTLFHYNNVILNEMCSLIVWPWVSKVKVTRKFPIWWGL